MRRRDFHVCPHETLQVNGRAILVSVSLKVCATRLRKGVEECKGCTLWVEAAKKRNGAPASLKPGKAVDDVGEE